MVRKAWRCVGLVVVGPREIPACAGMTIGAGRVVGLACGVLPGFFRKGLVRRARNLVQAWSIQMRGMAQARVRAMLMKQANSTLPVWPMSGRAALKAVAPAESMIGPCRR